MIGYVVLGTNDLARATAIDKPMLCIMKPYDGEPATVGNGLDGNKLDVFSYD